MVPLTGAGEVAKPRACELFKIGLMWCGVYITGLLGLFRDLPRWLAGVELLRCWWPLLREKAEFKAACQDFYFEEILVCGNVITRNPTRHKCQIDIT